MYDAEYRKKYYQEHKEHLRELNRGYKRAYRLRDREKIREADRRYYQEHKEEIRQRTRRYQEEHREKQREYNRGYFGRSGRALKLKDKIEVMTYYGNGKCACVICGESRVGCLSIDHLNNDGYADRKKNRGRFGIEGYRWLKRQGYPKGYRTLCMNCQFLRRKDILQ